MSDPFLSIHGLDAGTEDATILHNLNLEIPRGEIHVIMGPNGAGKSTLMNVLCGSPEYRVTKGSITFCGEDITHATPDARARAGIFMSFQNPLEVEGVTLENFLRLAKQAITGKDVSALMFRLELWKTMESLGMDKSYAQRSLNAGFSGGEKKKGEIVQLLTLDPQLAVLDETDSGLDVDAVRIVSEGIERFHSERNSLIIITHNTKLLEGLPVTAVHIIEGGKVALEGGVELVDRVARDGFTGLVSQP